MKVMDNTNWSVMTESEIQAILNRLDQLYRDLPLEYAGVALAAIEDIEDILYKRNITL